jgi:hypothetical protein
MSVKYHEFLPWGTNSENKKAQAQILKIKIKVSKNK